MPECRIEALALARQPLNEIEAMLALTSVTLHPRAAPSKPARAISGAVAASPAVNVRRPFPNTPFDNPTGRFCISAH